jgi:hypothetical protein
MVSPPRRETHDPGPWIKQEPDIYDQCFNETLHTFGSEWPSSTGETDE